MSAVCKRCGSFSAIKVEWCVLLINVNCSGGGIIGIIQYSFESCTVSSVSWGCACLNLLDSAVSTDVLIC